MAPTETPFEAVCFGDWMKIPAWTNSQLEAFETCPKKYYHLRVARDVSDPPTEHTEWGNRVHKAFEERVAYNVPLATGMEQWEPLAQKIAALPGQKYPEYKLAIDDAFSPTGWRAAWSRGVADLLVVNGQKAAVLDYKTGKRKPSDQLRLYAAYTFVHFPEVDVVQTGFVWLKDKKIDKETITRTDSHQVWQEFLPRVSKLVRAYEKDSWPARPSGLCRAWCPVVQCEFNGRRGSSR